MGNTRTDSSLRIRIAVPTYRRREQLVDLLDELERQVDARKFRGREIITTVVIDNDPSGTAQDIAHRRDVQYVIEPEPGIAAVRNRGLAESSDQDAMIFIDDDELPAPGWLDALLTRFVESGSDAVAGRVVTPFPDDVPTWIRESGAFIRPERRDGDLLTEAATNNLIVDLGVVRALGLSFDERFGLTGGSDSLFTRQLTAAGATIVWAQDALVEEREDSTRFTRDWVLRRTYRLGNTMSRVDLVLARSPFDRAFVRGRNMVAGLARVVAGSMAALVGRATGSVAAQGRGERRASRGRGMIAGALGHAYDEYALRRVAEST